PSTPIPGITERYNFLSETEVLDLVTVYIPDDTVTADKFSAWMSKDGCWATTKFTWDDLSNIQIYRSLVKFSMATKCTVGYVRKSNTHE
ncbi:hypothetical protein BD408DRAFT_320974, partial [Parasitella parasitica]